MTRIEQAHARETDCHNWYVSLEKTGWRVGFIKQSDLRRLAGILTEEFDRLAPSSLLSAIELAKVKNLTLEGELGVSVHFLAKGYRYHFRILKFRHGEGDSHRILRDFLASNGSTAGRR